MEPLFDVCYAGELLEGQDLQSVRLKLQKLFNANPETLDKLFSGKPQILKRRCDEATALKYQEAMAKAGAMALIRPANNPKPTAIPKGTKPGAAAGLVLTPPGSDVLRPDERAAPITADIDTSSLNITQVDSTVSNAQTDTGAAPDTTHLSLADAGDDTPNLTANQTASPPDTSGISLSPEGTDFSDCSPPPPPAPTVDLSGIKLAPTGADVLEQQYKKTDEGTAPDTSHISLD
jgi:hypothetical protein